MATACSIWSSTPAARTPTTRTWPIACRPRSRCISSAHHALLALQGPMAAAVLGDLAPDAAKMAFMTARDVEHRRHRLRRLALRLHRRGRLRNLGAPGRRRCAREETARRSARAADRARRARLTPPRSRPLPLRPRHRHDDIADRSRSRLEHPEAATHRRRVSRRRAHPGRTRQRPETPARRHQARRPRARARRHGDSRRGRRQDRHDHVRRLRPERQRPDRHGLRAADQRQRRHESAAARCAASRCRPKSSKLPFAPHRYFKP